MYESEMGYIYSTERNGTELRTNSRNGTERKERVEQVRTEDEFLNRIRFSMYYVMINVPNSRTDNTELEPS